jgi:hypothetical protein
MIDYIYEVRGTHDPIDGDKVVFTNKQEALDYADNYKEAEVYLVQLEVDDFNGVPTKTAEVQIRGPEVSANLADETIPNSCDADNPDCYDEAGNFRYPEYDDDLDDELVDNLDADFEEGYDDRRGHDPINRRERVNMEEVSVDESLEDDDDMTDQEFAEALYNALAAKREEDAFPEGELDMDPPADDVPVVKCKITPLATHSEDEKPLNEEDSVSSDLDAAIDQ